MLDDEEITVTKCLHTFHRDCLEQLIDEQATQLAKKKRKGKLVGKLTKEDGLCCPKCS